MKPRPKHEERPANKTIEGEWNGRRGRGVKKIERIVQVKLAKSSLRKEGRASHRCSRSKFFTPLVQSPSREVYANHSPKQRKKRENELMKRPWKG